ncbi:Uncharacterised protein [Streptococcus pseudoporcinus]|uniref:Uncharacterized protein n=1 Tax=Streptococcus pseudoporcinus TaxID=361101 RepID=A0A4U9ZKN2_9STRE|nr:hypothetical protein [Streptococcus pseudoporcinus]VTS40084.1 Uncharacterised protein [Streptococcus pseudoporcinus]
MKNYKLLQAYCFVVAILFLGTSFYIFGSQHTFKLNWFVILIISILYFNSEKISNILNTKIFYILLLILSYILSKFFDKEFFKININLMAAIIIFLIFLIFLISFIAIYCFKKGE